MKKLVSILVVFSMLFCTTTGFADAFDDLYDILYESQDKTAMSCTVTMELDNTLDFLKAFKIPYSEFIDTYRLTEGLFDTSSTLNAEVVSEDNFKKAKMHMEFVLDVPVVINEDLKVAVWSRFSIWIEYDLTDADNPVFNYIFKLPVTDKYLTMDLVDLGLEGYAFDTMIASVDNMESYEDDVKALLKEYSVVKKTNSGYTLTISKDNCSKYIMDVFEISRSAYTDEEMQAAYDEILPLIESYINETGLFGEDGITVEYTVKNKNLVSAVEMVDMSVTIPFANPETGEQTTEVIDFVIKSDTTYTPAKDVVVNMPVLTEENSVSFNEFTGSEPGGAYNDYLWPMFEGAPYTTATDTYLPLNAIMGDMKIAAENIVRTDNVVVITSYLPFARFESLTLTLGSASVVKDGVSYSVPGGIIEYNDNLWISEKLLNEVLETQVEYFDYYYNDEGIISSTSVCLSREFRVEDYYYEDDTDNYEEYIEPVLTIYGGYDAPAFLNGGVHYFEFDELMANCGADSIKVEYGVETAPVTSANIPYSQISVAEGFRLAVADYKPIELNNPVISIDGSLYVPAEFIYKVLGYRISYVSSYGSYAIEYDNPDFVYEDPAVWWITDYDIPYIDGEIYVPFVPFAEQTGVVTEGVATTEHNGKVYITSSNIEQTYGFKLFGIHTYFDAEYGGLYTDYQFEKISE